MSAWQKEFANQPAFAHLTAWLDGFDAEAWPDLHTLNALALRQDLQNARGIPIRFTAQASPCGQHEYESVIHASGCVPSREHNWHDLFNALTWLAFPATKAALNSVHQTALPPGRNRTPVSDAATLFDESGLVLTSEDSELAELLAARRWQEALVDQRARWSQIGVHVIGHAVLEKLLAPRPGITAKCLFIRMPADTDRERVDLAIAQRWRDCAIVGPAALFPLPVLGRPGWWPANEEPGF